MRTLVCILATLSVSAASAAATDSRIRTVEYEPQSIVRITGKLGIQSTIEFGADERIENVAVGDSAAWQITPNRRASLLFLKPLSRTSRTNMTVVTDRNVYMFDLVAGGTGAAPVYALRFTYPNAPQTPASAAAEAKPEPAAAPAFAPEQLNFGWTVKGSGRLRPRRIFDDGKALYLEWDRTASLPAILSLSGKVEGPVNYRVSGDFIVIDPLPANILLRQGKKTASIVPGRPLHRPTTPATQPAIAKPVQAPTMTDNRAITASRSVRMPNIADLQTEKLAGADDEQ